jgi:hypothetical protein
VDNLKSRFKEIEHIQGLAHDKFDVKEVAFEREKVGSKK